MDARTKFSTPRISGILALVFIAQYATIATAKECSSMVCCELTKEELGSCGKVDAKCPGYTGIGALGKNGECDVCPDGQCRVGNTCMCPEDFVQNTEFHDLCKEQYGRAWPDSQDRENTVCESTASATPATESNSTSSSTSSSSFGVVDSVENAIDYIREQGKQGRNVVGLIATGVLILLILAACCCMWTRRR